MELPSPPHIFGGALDQLHGSFSDIGAHQDLQKPTFVMPEPLIKERLNDYHMYYI